MLNLKGTLEELRTTQLFNLINLTKRTGTLHVYDGVPSGREIMAKSEPAHHELPLGKERARMAFKEGKLIHALAGGQDGHLASLLYKSGKLTETQYQVLCKKAANYSDRALALLLMNANYVSQQEVVECVQRQTLGIAYEVMTWTKEPFSFADGEQPPVDRITVAIDLDEVIREMHRNRDTMELSVLLPNLDVRLKFASVAPADKSKQTTLTRVEWNVLGYITGQNSIRQIAEVLTLTDTEIRRAVSNLLASGLVELDEPASAPSRGGASRPSSPLKGQTPAGTNRHVDRTAYSS